MAVAYEISIRDYTGTEIALLTSGKNMIWRSLYFTHIENAPGVCRLEIDGDSDLAADLLLDYQIVVTRSDLAIGLAPYVEWEGFIVTLNPDTDSHGDSRLTIYGSSYLDLIRRRAIWHYAGSSGSDKSGVGETVIKEFVNENAGPGATTPPRILQSGVTPGLTMQADGGLGGAWEGSRSYRNVLDVIREIATATGLAYDVIGTGAATFEFRVYEGQRGVDRTNTGLDTTTGLNAAGNAPVIFALDSGNMTEPTFTESHSDEINAVLVLGQNREDDRDVVAVIDAAAIAASPWARRETTRNASGETAAGLQSVGEQLIAESIAQERLNFKILQLPSIAYGLPAVDADSITQFYWFGDLITARYQAESNKRLANVQISVNSQSGGEEISVNFADVNPVNMQNPQQLVAYRVSQLTKRIDVIESRDPGAGIVSAGDAQPFVQIVSSAAKTAIYSETILADALSTLGFVDIEIPIQYLNNTGGNTTFIITVDWGAATPFTYTTAAIATSANERHGAIRLRLANTGAANTQRLELAAHLSAAVANGTATTRGGQFDVVIGNTGAQDTTADKVLTISITLSSNSSNHAIRALGAQVGGPHLL
jgi:hypothetical protein